MIDTIRVKFPISPSPIQLNKGWDKQIRLNANHTNREKYTYNPIIPDLELTIRCTYYPLDYSGHPMTTIELSLPKAVFGNNYYMVHDIEEAISCVNKLLSSDPFIPKVDIGEGILLRFDPCYNHMVGELVPYYVNAIASLDYPHRRTKHHRNEGAEFRSKHTTTKFYNKQRETVDPNAFGILRQETTFLTSKRISSIFGKKHPTLRDITPDLISSILISDLSHLKLNGNSIADRDTALSTLTNKYGSFAGMYYWGVLKARIEKSNQSITSENKMHPRSLNRRIKAITDAGIAPTLTDYSEPLPPLEIKL
jgi:hypothetical protein